MLKPFLARVVVVGDGLQPVVLRILRQMIERDHRVRQVVEQRIHMRVEQRQPVLHARIAAAGRHRLVKRVVALAWPEQLDIALAEMLDRPFPARQLADGQERDVLARGLGALRDGIELPDAFERIAEKVEAHGRAWPGANRSIMPPRTAYSPGSITVPAPVEAGRLKPVNEMLHLKPAAGGNPRGSFLMTAAGGTR